MREVVIDDIGFEKEVLDSPVPVLLDFYADWCGPCKLIAPILSEIAEEYEGKIKVCKLNVDSEPSLAQAFGIESIPTVMAFSGGQIAGQIVGLATKEKLLDLVK